MSCWTLHRLGLEAAGDPSAPGDLRWCKTKRKRWRCNDSGARDSHHRQKSGNKTGCEACKKMLSSSVTVDVLLSASVCTTVHAFPHLWGKIPVRATTLVAYCWGTQEASFQVTCSTGPHQGEEEPRLFTTPPQTGRAGIRASELSISNSEKPGGLITHIPESV